jgi:hypothetical protein
MAERGKNVLVSTRTHITKQIYQSAADARLKYLRFGTDALVASCCNTNRKNMKIKKPWVPHVFIYNENVVEEEI